MHNGTGSGDPEPEAWTRIRRQARIQRITKRHPFLSVGLPFLVAVVGGSFVLLLTQETKYEVRDKRIQNLSMDEALPPRRKFDIQEEYFRMKSKGDWNGSWEPRRVPRAAEDEPVFDRYDK
ncbi:Cytochrome oxidase assembly [Coemansia sp. RSA 376]|nr:Cytochrome oxidase assembly [Coemansia sp. S17]KAJ2020964.1 Cytochrome oxidase assembly [Coemansia sp. S680]KAJ2031969.1 Cytochrome oxidase assembly [Coemansia sp. S2]KAJ2047093.1 Cytochrome oxidase assembly [Coemansia sp. S16]KAJ2084761.1 Cytochrome oxidase assembly [Coemansia sp. S100]KAJ2110220.1 Cytochrome oxidase assembly [Coemansia sp. RSA 922]KAJ2261141.1 Cytochrome oxidase assembly [Coemansia sp. RSA 376]